MTKNHPSKKMYTRPTWKQVELFILVLAQQLLQIHVHTCSRISFHFSSQPISCLETTVMSISGQWETSIMQLQKHHQCARLIQLLWRLVTESIHQILSQFILRLVSDWSTNRLIVIIRLDIRTLIAMDQHIFLELNLDVKQTIVSSGQGSENHDSSINYSKMLIVRNFFRSLVKIKERQTIQWNWINWKIRCDKPIATMLLSFILYYRKLDYS